MAQIISLSQSSEYDPQSNNWVCWKETFGQFLEKQSIPKGDPGEIKKRAFLLVAIGEKAFNKLWEKLVPIRPSMRTYGQLLAALDELFVGESLESAGEDGKQVFSPQSATPSPNISGQHVKPSSSSPGTCYRCGKSGHVEKDCCLPEGVSCCHCGVQGHTVSACPERRASQEAKETSDNEDNVKESPPGQFDVLTVHGINAEGPPPIVQEFCINGKIVQFELHTGAMLSLVGRSTWIELGSPRLSQSSSKLRDVSGRPMKVLGECQVTVNQNSQTFLLPLVIVDEVEVKFCGRNWISIMQLMSVNLPQVNQLSESDKSNISNIVPMSVSAIGASESQNISGNASPVSQFSNALCNSVSSGSVQSEMSQSPSLSAAGFSPGSPVEATIAAMDNQLVNSSVPALPCQAISRNVSNSVLVGKEEVCVVPTQLVCLSYQSQVQKKEKVLVQSSHLFPQSKAKVEKKSVHQNPEFKSRAQSRVWKKKPSPQSQSQSKVWKKLKVQQKKLKVQRRKKDWKSHAQSRVKIKQVQVGGQVGIDKGRHGRVSMPMKKGRPKVKIKLNQEPVQETVDLEEPRSSGG